MNELNELRDQAYENSLIYKEKTKRIHDAKIKNRVFNVGDRVLLFNSRLKIFSGKLKSRWSGPFTVTQVFPYGTVELSQNSGPNFKVNGHRLKHYFGGDIPTEDFPDCEDSHARSIHMSFTSSASFWESNMAPLPAADQRHPWLRYQIEEYNEGIRHRSGSEIEDGVFWRGAAGVREMSDTEMGLDVADTLCFQLGGVRRRMTWRQFILALGLHTEQEMAEAGDFLGPAPSYVLIRDPVRRLCHRMIAYSISGVLWLRGKTEKVTGVDLFYLRSMDRGTTNVPHLLAQYLFRHAEGRKSGARLSGGHFIGRLAMHFGLVSDEGLRGLQAALYVAGAIRLMEAGLVSCGGLGGRLSRALLDQADLDSPHWLITIAWDSARRRVRPKTGDASTFATPHTDAQPNP
ncbi:hypothetical protein Tco_1312206 [Tanacetum coccineum]